MGKPETPKNTRHTRKYPKYPKVKKITGITWLYISTLLPDPNPTYYLVFCSIPNPTWPDIEKPYPLGTVWGTLGEVAKQQNALMWFTNWTLTTEPIDNIHRDRGWIYKSQSKAMWADLDTPIPNDLSNYLTDALFKSFRYWLAVKTAARQQSAIGKVWKYVVSCLLSCSSLSKSFKHRPNIMKAVMFFCSHVIHVTRLVHFYLQLSHEHVPSWW